MKHYLVTGGAGFIGSNYIHYILNTTSAIKITNIDALTYAGNLENLIDIESDSRYEFIHGDINDSQLLEEIFSNRAFDKVIHFAAESHVDRSIKDPLLFIQTNVMGTANLLLNAYNYWLKLDQRKKSSFRFLQISTDEVFGSLGQKDRAFTELTPYAPNSPYAASKAAGDLLVQSYFHTFGFPIIITNCSNNFGPAMAPALVICPIMNMDIAFCFARSINCDVHSRT